MKKTKNIGIDVKPPKQKCEDKKCPFHGSLKVHGRQFTGIIIKADAHRSATIEFERSYFVPKYERNEKRRTRIRAHNPSCVDAKKGDKVIIAECKPISKTKGFVIIEKIGTDILFKQKEEALEESKFKEKKKEGMPKEKETKQKVE